MALGFGNSTSFWKTLKILTKSPILSHKHASITDIWQYGEKNKRLEKMVGKYCEREQDQSKDETTFKKDSLGCANRTAKKQGTNKAKTSLPATPSKKAAIITTIMNCPRTRQILENEGTIKTPQRKRNHGQTTVQKRMEEVKQKAFTAFKYLAFGKNVRKQMQKISFQTGQHTQEKYQQGNWS